MDKYPLSYLVQQMILMRTDVLLGLDETSAIADRSLDDRALPKLTELGQLTSLVYFMLPAGLLYSEAFMPDKVVNLAVGIQDRAARMTWATPTYVAAMLRDYSERKITQSAMDALATEIFRSQTDDYAFAEDALEHISWHLLNGLTLPMAVAEPELIKQAVVAAARLQAQMAYGYVDDLDHLGDNMKAMLDALQKLQAKYDPARSL